MKEGEREMSEKEGRNGMNSECDHKIVHVFKDQKPRQKKAVLT